MNIVVNFLIVPLLFITSIFNVYVIFKKFSPTHYTSEEYDSSSILEIIKKSRVFGIYNFLFLILFAVVSIICIRFIPGLFFVSLLEITATFLLILLSNPFMFEYINGLEKLSKTKYENEIAVFYEEDTSSVDDSDNVYNFLNNLFDNSPFEEKEEKEKVESSKTEHYRSEEIDDEDPELLFNFFKGTIEDKERNKKVINTAEINDKHKLNPNLKSIYKKIAIFKKETDYIVENYSNFLNSEEKHILSVNIPNDLNKITSFLSTDRSIEKAENVLKDISVTINLIKESIKKNIENIEEIELTKIANRYTK